ncbi:MAG TPA: hypothetical protein VF331_09890 [Polyangiales bacterium]
MSGHPANTSRTEDLPHVGGTPRHLRCLLIALCLLAAAGCDREAAKRSEARQLLALLMRLSEQRELAPRQQVLDELGRLPLHESSHRHARDTCHKAHAGLLRGETAQALAKQELERAQTTHPNGPLPAERATAISALITRSNEALASSAKLFPQCEVAMAQLTIEAR